MNLDIMVLHADEEGDDTAFTKHVATIASPEDLPRSVELHYMPGDDVGVFLRFRLEELFKDILDAGVSFEDVRAQLIKAHIRPRR